MPVIQIEGNINALTSFAQILWMVHKIALLVISFLKILQAREEHLPTGILVLGILEYINALIYDAPKISAVIKIVPQALLPQSKDGIK